jgi:hypothetical protein
MELTQTSGLDNVLSRGDVARDRKVMRVRDPYFAPVVRLLGTIASTLNVHWMGDCTFCPPTFKSNNEGVSAVEMTPKNTQRVQDD